jgi:electron transfer flavoprotein-quinone oxidoreductase
MKEVFDCAIVGAGPAGIAAAYCLAQRKRIKTIVFERGEYPGAKNISGGVLYGHDLAQVIPDYEGRRCPIERHIVESRIWYLSQDGGYSLSYRDKAFGADLRYNAFTVGRARFDRWFAEQAQAAGALVVCGTVVTDLMRANDGRVIGVVTDRPGGEVRAKVVLLADGINSPLAAKTGFRPEPNPHQVALAVKEVIELPEEVIDERFAVEPGQGVTIEVMGATTQGMDGVGVIYTNKKSLSVCIGALVEDLAQHKIRPYEMLELFKAHPMVAPLIKGGKPVEYMAHWLAEGGYAAIPQLCGDGFLIAGDSGMLFNALHREGSNMAMASGRLAAEAIIEALKAGDTSQAGLSGYIKRLQGSYVLEDLKKYRGFGAFLRRHREIFTTLPGVANSAAREMLTVNGVSKKQKQQGIWREIRKAISFRRLVKLLWAGWRSVR